MADRASGESSRQVKATENEDENDRRASYMSCTASSSRRTDSTWSLTTAEPTTVMDDTEGTAEMTNSSSLDSALVIEATPPPPASSSSLFRGLNSPVGAKAKGSHRRSASQPSIPSPKRVSIPNHGNRKFIRKSLPIKHHQASSLPQTLDFSQQQTLYGREDELAVLHAAVDRAHERTVQTLTIQGDSGTGKSALLNAFCQQHDNNNSDVLVCRAKFEQATASSEPFPEIVAAMKQLLDALLLHIGTSSSFPRTKWRHRFLETLLPSEMDILILAIPKLRQIVKADSMVHLIQQEEAQAESTDHPYGIFSSRATFAMSRSNSERMPRRQLVVDEQPFLKTPTTSSRAKPSSRNGLISNSRWKMVVSSKNLRASSEFWPRSTTNSASVYQKDWGFDRLRLALRTLVRVLATEYTTIFAMDDIQWADQQSLTLLETILNDELPGRKLLFVSTMRTGAELPKSVMTANRGMIVLDCLSKTAISQWIQAPLRHDQEEVASLVEVVYKKTGGNPFFTIQFLCLLVDQGLIWYDGANLRWKWDALQIQAKTDICTNILDVVAGQIRWLPQDLQMILIIASCLGLSRFDLDTLWLCLDPSEAQGSMIGEDDSTHKEVEMSGIESDQELLFGADEMDCQPFSKESLSGKVALIAKQGLLEKLSPSRFKFSHDKVREGAYLLFPDEGARKQLHLRIGKRLRTTREGLDTPKRRSKRGDDLLLQTVRQLNFGSDLISDEEEKLDLAELNYVAAELAMQRSSFVPATAFLTQAKNLLGSDPWSEHPFNMQKLSTAMARMEYCCGRLDNSLRVADDVIVNSPSPLESKLGVYHTKILCLTQAGRGDEALRLTLFVLDQLGLPFPRSSFGVHLLIETRKTRKMLRGMTDEDLATLSPARYKGGLDTKTDFIERLFDVSLHSQHPHPEYTSLVLLTMIQLTLKQGRSTRTALSFVLWGWYLASLGEFEDALRFGTIGLKYAERGQGGIHDARARLLFHTYIHHWKFPYYKGVDPLSKAVKAYWDAGAVELVHIETLPYLSIYFCCGLRLGPLYADMQRFARLMKDYQQMHSLENCLPYFQMIANLMGMSDDPLVFTGEFMNETVDMKMWRQCKNERALQKLYFHRMMLAYYFGDVGVAWDMCQLLWSPRVEGPGLWLPYRHFFHGLTAFGKFQATQKRKFYRIGVSVIKQMKKWIHKGVVNCLHMLLLLLAEHLASESSDVTDVRSAYDDAIVSAAKLGFVSTQAMGNERAGAYCLAKGDTVWAATYLKRSCSLYKQWGATAKARHILQKYSSILDASSQSFELTPGGDLRARTQLDHMTTELHESLRMNRSTDWSRSWADVGWNQSVDSSAGARTAFGY